MILFRIFRFFRSEESVWSEITNPFLDSPKKKAPRVRASSHKPGWLAQPRWLWSRYYMKRARPESPFLYRDWKQCAWAVCYPLSCLSLGWFARRPVSVITWKISTLDLGITNTRMPANRAGSVVLQGLSKGTSWPWQQTTFFWLTGGLITFSY